MSSETTHALVTCAGRKGYVVDALRASAGAGRIVACDADPEAAVAMTAPAFACVPSVGDPRCVAALLELCERHDIHCVLPTNDADLALLAAAADRFAARGVRVLGPSAATVDLLSDKLAAATWLEQRGFATPETFGFDKCAAAIERFGWPLLAKARRGQGSAGLCEVRGAADLARLGADSVLQPRVEGPEFNLDVLRGPDGVVSVVPKRKLDVFCGGTQQAQCIDAPELIEVGVRLGDAIGHLGSIDVDVILAEEAPVVLDVNPRLGGGFPFSAIFCPRYVDALLEIGRGGAPTPFLGEYRSGATAFREFRYAERPAPQGSLRDAGRSR